MKLFNSKVIYAIVTLLVVALNWQFVRVHKVDDLPHPMKTWDMSAIIAGYEKSPQFLGGMKFWTGPWIYDHAPYSSYRPVASVIHWVQCWLIENAGWVWASIITLALFWGICMAVTGLIWRWTKSGALALLAGTMVAGIRFFNSGHPDLWLGWFPVADFLASLAFLLTGMLLLDVYSEREKVGQFVASLVFFLAACLSKELAYMFPVIGTLIVCTRAEKNRLWPCVSMFVAAGALLLIRRAAIGNGRGVEFDLSKAYNYIFERNALFFTVRSEQYWLLLLSALLVAFVLSVWKFGLKRVAPYSIAGAVVYLLICVLLMPEALIGFESPVNALESAIGIALVPLGTILVLRDRIGRMSLLILATIYIPMLPFVHNQLFHYTLTTALFSVLHTSVLTSILWRSWCEKPKVKDVPNTLDRLPNRADTHLPAPTAALGSKTTS